jgi:cytochrome c oxidase assembly protein subunit 15
MTEPAPAVTHAPLSRRLRGYAWAVLAYNVAVILWGAAVRATSSGNGCGDHWPLCNGTVIQQHPTIATLIEFTHRAMSGIALIAVIALVIWTFLATPKRHLARIAAVVSLILILNEALIGALLVLLGMTANNQSPSRAVYLALHLTNTLLMLGALALTPHFLSRRRGAMRGSIETRHLALNLTGLVAIIVTGITGSIAALADTLHPAVSLRAAFIEDFSAHANWLVRIRWIHPLASLVAGLFVLEIIIKGTRIRAHHRHAASLILLLLLQYALGIADLTLLTPLSMQVLHLLGADILWIVLVILVARLSLRPKAPAPLAPATPQPV